MSLRSELTRLRKALASVPATEDATTGKPFRRFWQWCAGLLTPADLTTTEKDDWNRHRARLREQTMQSPQMLMLQDLRRERGLPPLTEPPDDVIEQLIALKRTPTPDTTKE